MHGVIYCVFFNFSDVYRRKTKKQQAHVSNCFQRFFAFNTFAGKSKIVLNSGKSPGGGNRGDSGVHCSEYYSN